MGAIVTSLVGRFSLTLRFKLMYACANTCLLPIKVLYVVGNPGRRLGMVLFVSTFAGCAQYTQHKGYVADPVCE
jgi:hypothetical protein